MKDASPATCPVRRLCAPLLLLVACATGKPPAARPAPSPSARAAALCLVNPTSRPGESDLRKWEQETVPLLRREAARVCEALGGVPWLSDRLRWADLQAALAGLPPERPRIIFYLGHGLRDDGTNQVLLPIADGARDTVPLAEVLTAAHPTGRGSHPDRWTLMILNTCESAYAHVSARLGDVTVMGAGWGLTSAEAARKDDPRSLTLFGEEVASGLAGAADLPPDGNCDGVVTDAELSNYVGYRVAQEARQDLELWLRAPVAALRRSRAVEHPLVQVRPEGQACSRALPVDPLVRRPAFADRLAIREQLRAGRAAVAHPPLVAIAAPDGARWIVDSLERAAAVVGFQLERVAPRDFPTVMTLARAAPVVSPIFWVEVQGEPSGGWSVQGLGGRNRYAWGEYLPRQGPAERDLGKILRHVPRTLEVVRRFGGVTGELRVTDGCPEQDGDEATVTVEGAAWTDLTRGASRWIEERLGKLVPAACPAFPGLCFEVPAGATDRLAPFFLRKAP